VLGASYDELSLPAPRTHHLVFIVNRGCAIERDKSVKCLFSLCLNNKNSKIYNLTLFSLSIMVTFTSEHKGVHGKAMYVAVPLRPTLTEILGSSEFKDDAFPMPDSPPHIEGRKIIVEANNSLVEIVAAFSKEKGDISQLYVVPNDGLDGTTLSISVIGKTPSTVDNIIKRLLSFFGTYIDLKMKPAVRPRFERAFQGALHEATYNFPFFEQYQKIRANLSDVQKLPNMKIKKGFIIDFGNEILKQVGITNFQSAYNVMLVKRIQGIYQNIPLELSLVHIFGPRLYPKVQGVFLYKKFESSCPSCEISTCDQAEAFAGHFLSAKRLVFGGVMLLPEKRKVFYKDQESGPQGQLDFCVKCITYIDSDSPFEKFEPELSKFASPLQVTTVSDDYKRHHPNPQSGIDMANVPNQFAKEQIEIMRGLTRLVYDSYNLNN